MHFTGTIWRPPYEADSLLLEVTAGCTHHRCKFCTLYDDLPFTFRMSPMEDIEADLQEAQLWQTGPLERLGLRLQGLDAPKGPRRVFLVGANPFVLKTERLEKTAELVRKYFPGCKTIGCFARVTDTAKKTDRELARLARAGFDGITIGVESGDGAALDFMDKGYAPEDILTQTRRLDQAGIGYHFFYLAGIAGAGKGSESAARSAEIFNQTHPKRIGSSMLTVFPESRLYQEIQAGNWQDADCRSFSRSVYASHQYNFRFINSLYAASRLKNIIQSLSQQIAYIFRIRDFFNSSHIPQFFCQFNRRVITQIA